MSWRQDNINLGEWNQFNTANPPYISNLQNDFTNMRQTTYVPAPTARVEQSSYMSIDQVLGLDQASSAMGTFYGINAPNDPSNTTRPSQFNTPLSNNDYSDHTVSPPIVKHDSIKSNANHTQGSKTNTRRAKKQIKIQSSSLICEWANCNKPGPFGCKASLMRHVNTQHIAPCSVLCLEEHCDKVFNRRDNMMNHFRSVHGDVW